MESIIALEELIQENEEKVQLHQRQLQRHESGQNILSAMALASAESHLEEATQLLQKYSSMLETLSQLSPEELKQKEQLHTAAIRKKYFDTQASRIKINHEHALDIKLEVLRILGELPQKIEFEDEDLFEMAQKSLELELPVMNELVSKLQEIQNDFKSFLKLDDKRSMQEFATIDFLVPIVVLHFYVLSLNIQESINEHNEKIEKNKEDLLQNGSKEEALETQQNQYKQFKGFPKYQDWWIRELWVSHQSYFALYNWKTLVMNMCMTLEQKKAWSIVFDRWVFIKKLLNDKGELAYEYNFAFDTLLEKYVSLEEELSEDKILAIETLIQEITKKEDLAHLPPFHDVKTPYYTYKLKKLTKGDS